MINWGIIGLGNMAQKFASSIIETKNSKLVGIASLNKDRLKSFQEKYNITNKNTYNNYEDLINCQEVHAIYIATLNNTHLEIIKKCAENKKDILCEKPVALNYDEAKIAYNYINKYNINFYEAIAYRVHPQTNEIKKIINQNEIGDIISIESNFGFKVKKIKPESRLFNKKLGGGCILDIGCYPMSILELFFNEKSKYQFLKVEGSFCSTNVEDHAKAEIIIDEKVNCLINVSFKENLDNKVLITGNKGVLTINNPWLPEKKSTLDISIDQSFYKKFINSDLSIYANQIQNISDNFIKKNKHSEFSVDIINSLHIMKNLTLWSDLIKKK